MRCEKGFRDYKSIINKENTYIVVNMFIFVMFISVVATMIVRHSGNWFMFVGTHFMAGVVTEVVARVGKGRADD